MLTVITPQEREWKEMQERIEDERRLGEALAAIEQNDDWTLLEKLMEEEPMP